MPNSSTFDFRFGDNDIKEKLFGTHNNITSLTGKRVALPVYPIFPQVVNLYENELREFLKFKPDIWNKAVNVFNHMKEHYCVGDPCTMIYVHVRIGDYVHYLTRFKEKVTVRTDYIPRAMEYYKIRYPVSCENWMSSYKAICCRTCCFMC